MSHCTLFGHIIDETKWLGGTLTSCMFQHVREGNRLAHSLAKNAFLSIDTDVWIKTLPKDVEDIFQSDLPWACFVLVLVLNNISLTFFSKKKIFIASLLIWKDIKRMVVKICLYINNLSL